MSRYVIYRDVQLHLSACSQPASADAATVFVGDALADLMALHAADVGIVIGENPLLQAALECAGALASFVSSGRKRNAGVSGHELKSCGVHHHRSSYYYILTPHHNYGA